MRVNSALPIMLFIGLASVVAGQGDPFPEYTPESIGAIRLDYARQSKYEDAIKLFHAWEAARGEPVTHADSAAWYAMKAAYAYTFFDLRILDSAEAVLKPVLNVSVRNFPKEYLQIQNGWGVRLIYGGRFSEACKHYERLRDILDAKQVEVTPDQYCNTVHNLGVAYSAVGDNDAALEVFHHIDDVVRENTIDDNRLKSNLEMNMAGAYTAIGDFEESAKHTMRGYEISVQEYGHDHPFSAQVLNSVGNSQVNKGDLGGALKTYKEVLNTFDRIGRSDHPLRTVAMLNLAETLDKMGNPGAALSYITACAALRLKADGIHHTEVARAFKAKGTILGHLGRFDEAVASMDTALLALGYDSNSEDPYSGVDAMFNLFYTLDQKADIFYDRAVNNDSAANLLAAKDAYIRGIQVLNDLRVHFKGRLAKGTLNHKSYSFYEPAIDLCLRLYEKTGDTKQLEQAMQWSGESKGNDFYDMVRSDEAMISANIPDSVRSRDDQFQEDLASMESAWYNAVQSHDSKATQAREEFDNAQSQYRSWLQSIETAYPRYFALLHKAPHTDLDAKRAELAQEQAMLLEYFVGDSNAFAFILTPDSLHGIRLASPSTISRAIQEWRNDFGTSSDASLEELSALVWQPLIPYLAVRIPHLVIIPDGPLASVPFEILADDEGRRIIDAFSVSYNFSSRESTKDRTAIRNHSWLGMAPEYDYEPQRMALASRGLDSVIQSRGDISWMKLPGAEAEVSSINAFTGGVKRIGKNATEKYFRTRANKFGILHLSMHALTDDREPLLSTLIFSQDKTDTVYDGKLYAHEIFQLDLPAKLAVLSACNTGAGPFRRGEGISSLARAFMYAGTESTVMSLWRVPDESTAVIMKAFYKHLRNGYPKDVALRNAKLDYLNTVTEPEQKRPYYWAGFVLMGDNSPVYGGATTMGIILIIIGVVMLGGLFVWIRLQFPDTAPRRD